VHLDVSTRREYMGYTVALDSSGHHKGAAVPLFTLTLELWKLITSTS